MTVLMDRETPAGAGLPVAWRVQGDAARVLIRGRASRWAPLVKAEFTSVQGTLTDQSVAVDVHVRSLTTGNRAYDEVLVRADPFDAARHPVARYRSEIIHWDGFHAVVDGLLSLRGRSAPVRLTASYEELASGAGRRLTATGRVDRRAFDLRLQVPGCGAFVPDHLDLSIDVVAVPVTPAFRASRSA